MKSYKKMLKQFSVISHNTSFDGGKLAYEIEPLLLWLAIVYDKHPNRVRRNYNKRMEILQKKTKERIEYFINSKEPAFDN